MFHKNNIPNSSTQEPYSNDTPEENTRLDLETPKRNIPSEQVIQPKKLFKGNKREKIDLKKNTIHKIIENIKKMWSSY